MQNQCWPNLHWGQIPPHPPRPYAPTAHGPLAHSGDWFTPWVCGRRLECRYYYNRQGSHSVRNPRVHPKFPAMIYGWELLISYYRNATARHTLVMCNHQQPLTEQFPLREREAMSIYDATEASMHTMHQGQIKGIAQFATLKRF